MYYSKIVIAKYVMKPNMYPMVYSLISGNKVSWVIFHSLNSYKMKRIKRNMENNGYSTIKNPDRNPVMKCASVVLIDRIHL